jgi:hypothetical protein
MSTLNVEHLKHENSSSNNVTMDSDGSVAIDTNTLYVDAVTNNVAIGRTDTSFGKLTVSGGYAYINEDGSNTKQLYLRSDQGGLGPAIQVATNHDLSIYTGNQQRMVVDTAGRVTMPYQPFARVRPVNGNQGTYTNGGNITCVWTDVVENVGGHYNSGNGRFTCPVAGLYEVAFNSNWYFGGSPGLYILPRIMKNGSEVYRYYQSVFGITWHQIQGVAQLTCSAGDYFTLENITASGTGGGADIGLYTHLTFRLIG